MIAEVREGQRAEGFRRHFPMFYALTGPLFCALTGLFRWLFWSRRRVLGLLALLVAAVALPAAWWALQLAGLPDIGEPFDAAAFRAETIPDGRNAFVLYRRAAALYRPLRVRPKQAGPPGAVDVAEPVGETGEVDFALANGVPLRPRSEDLDWRTAPEEVRAWVRENREALDLFREGSELPNALDPSHLAPDGGVSGPDPLPLLLRLALLEASRLESLGDMDGARAWYRAALRAVHHYGRRARAYRRMDGRSWHAQVNTRLLWWSVDPRTTPAQIRRAVDDVRSCDGLEPLESYTVKAEYVFTAPVFDATSRPPIGARPRWLGTLRSLSAFGTGVPFLTTERVNSLARAWRVWRREPERSRRVFRLVTANRLAYEALPPDRRPAPEPSYTFCDLYPVGPDAPPAARAVSAKALGRWLDSCADAPLRIPMSVGNRFRARDLADRQALLDLLTSELARRRRRSPEPPAGQRPAPCQSNPHQKH